MREYDNTGIGRILDHATQENKCESVCKGTIREGGAKEREGSAYVARILELVVIVIVMKEGRVRQGIIKSCKLVPRKGENAERGSMGMSVFSKAEGGARKLLRD
jgi:hypothetical protein